MRAFERVSRTIQRLCNGYTSLPGLVEWGRLTAARLETTTAVGDRCGLGGDGSWGGRVDGTAIATANHRPAYGGGGGGRRDRRAVNDPGAEGQGPWSVAGLCDSRDFAAPSSAHFDGAGSLFSEKGAFDLGARASATTAASSLWSVPASASTASLAGRPRNTMFPSSTHSTKETTHYFPKKTSGVGGRHNQEGRAEGTRYSLKTAGPSNTGGQSSGDAEYGGGGGGGSASSGLAGFHVGGGKGGSSVASLLREERAFQRRTGALQG